MKSWMLKGQDRIWHYPELVYTSTTFSDSEWPTERIDSQVYRHVMAKKITKAILRRHEMPDSTYCGLEVLGASFVCERCEDKGPRTWDGLLNHYIEEERFYDRFREREPIIQTSHPIVFRNSHDLSSTEKPFVRLLSDQEPGDPRLTLNVSQMLDCMLCKNLHYRRTTRNAQDVRSHLLDRHDATHGLYGVTFESSAEFDCYHERGQKWRMKWKREWDAYCNANP